MAIILEKQAMIVPTFHNNFICSLQNCAKTKIAEQDILKQLSY